MTENTDTENSATVTYWFGDTDTYHFRDIVVFEYRKDSSLDDYYYLLIVNKLTVFGLHRVTIFIGRNETDRILYNGVSYGTRDFPELAKLIHNRNTASLLEDLE